MLETLTKNIALEDRSQRISDARQAFVNAYVREVLDPGYNTPERRVNPETGNTDLLDMFGETDIHPSMVAPPADQGFSPDVPEGYKKMIDPDYSPTQGSGYSMGDWLMRMGKAWTGNRRRRNFDNYRMPPTN